jgi:hypothetical protein
LIFNKMNFISITKKDLWSFMTVTHLSSIHNSPFRSRKSLLEKVYSCSNTNVQTKNHNTLKKLKFCINKSSNKIDAEPIFFRFRAELYVSILFHTREIKFSSREECVFPMVVYVLPQAEFGLIDHQEDPAHFIPFY